MAISHKTTSGADRDGRRTPPAPDRHLGCREGPRVRRRGAVPGSSGSQRPLRRRARALDRPGGAGLRLAPGCDGQPSPLGRGRPRPAHRRLVRRPDGAGGTGRRPVVAVRRDPSRRADQRPRLRRPRPLGGFSRRPGPARGRRLPRPRVPRPNHQRRARAGRAFPPGPALPRWVVGVLGGAGGRSPTCRGGLCALPGPPPDPVGPGPARARVDDVGGHKGEAQAEGPRQGSTGLPDQPDRAARLAGPPDGASARTPRCRRQALGRVGAAIRHRPGPPIWCRGGSARPGGRRARPVPVGSGRPRDRLG